MKVRSVFAIQRVGQDSNDDGYAELATRVEYYVAAAIPQQDAVAIADGSAAFQWQRGAVKPTAAIGMTVIHAHNCHRQHERRYKIDRTAAVSIVIGTDVAVVVEDASVHGDIVTMPQQMIDIGITARVVTQRKQQAEQLPKASQFRYCTSTLVKAGNRHKLAATPTGP